MTNANFASLAPVRRTSANITICRKPCGASAASIGICSGGVGRRPMKRKSCEDCVYYRPYSCSARGERGCHYLFDTNQKRGCPVEGCTKKKVGVAKRRTDPFDGTIGR